MSAASVIVLCPNGRRVTTKLSANSPLLTVLEQACEKQGYSADEYELRRGKVVVDLSVPFRYSGLTNNAKLEMAPAEKPRKTDEQVIVSVQSESGGRVQGTFSSSTYLWDVLVELGVSIDGEENMASIVYMRQQVTGKEKLSTTTLKALGVSSGRVSLRLLTVKSSSDKEVNSTCDSMVTVDGKEALAKRQKPDIDTGIRRNDKTEETTEQATPTSCRAGNIEFIEFPVLPFTIFPEEKPTDSTNRDEHQMEVDTPTNQYDKPEDLSTNQMSPPQESEMEVITTTATSSLPFIRQPSHDKIIYEGPCERNPVIFDLNDSVSVPIAEVADEFFEPTIDDVQKIHRDLQRKVKELNDAPLLTQQLRETKRCSYGRTVIRIIFPDRWVLQGTFNSGESIKSLVVFVREHLADENVKFHLYTTPPKEVLKSSRPTFASKGFVPAANIYCGLSADDSTVPDASTSDNGSVFLSAISIGKYKRESVEADLMASKERPTVSTDQLITSVIEAQVNSSSGTLKSHPVITSGTGISSTKSTAGKPAAQPSSNSQQKIPKWFKTAGNK